MGLRLFGCTVSLMATTGGNFEGCLSLVRNIAMVGRGLDVFDPFMLGVT